MSSSNWSMPSASLSMFSAVCGGSGVTQGGIHYLGDRCCLVDPRNSAVEFCPEPVEKDTVHAFPVGGLHVGNFGSRTSIRAWCSGDPSLPVPTAVDFPSSPSVQAKGGASFRPNPNNRPKQGGMNNNVRTLLTHPATSILLGVNVLLAFVYGNNEVPPSSVAKICSKIVVKRELW